MSHITPPYADNYDSKGPDKLCMENVSSMEESIVDYREDRRIAGRLPIDPRAARHARSRVKPGFGRGVARPRDGRPRGYSLKIQMMRRTAMTVKRISRATKGPQSILASRRAAGLCVANANS